jgi:SAM-dependent methyltransferase
MATPLTDLFDVRVRDLHNDAQVVGEDPLEIVTPAQKWSYAFSTPARRTVTENAFDRMVITARVTVTSGRIGVGWTLAGSDDFVVERYVTPGADRDIVLRIIGTATAGRLMFRNASPSGRSRFILHGIDAYLERPPYPVDVNHREVSGHSSESGAGVFDADLALSINQARLDFLQGLELPLQGKRVLDAGCGVGHHTPFYSSRGCTVIGIDGRTENIEIMKTRYPEVTGIVGDVQEMDLERLGPFDVVHCFGLLYHLDSPIAALRRLAAVCGEYLLLETMVCDAKAPVMVLADESDSLNQALAGLGCRPSPSFVAMTLDRLGFRHVYGTTDPPRHPDFLFDWRDSLDVRRDGNNLRCMFVASREPIQHPRLVELIRSL